MIPEAALTRAIARARRIHPLHHTSARRFGKATRDSHDIVTDSGGKNNDSDVILQHFEFGENSREDREGSDSAGARKVLVMDLLRTIEHSLGNTEEEQESPKIDRTRIDESTIPSHQSPPFHTEQATDRS